MGVDELDEGMCIFLFLLCDKHTTVHTNTFTPPEQPQPISGRTGSADESTHKRKNMFFKAVLHTLVGGEGGGK